MLEKILLILIAILGVYLYNNINTDAKLQILKAVYNIPAQVQQFNPQITLNK